MGNAYRSVVPPGPTPDPQPDPPPPAGLTWAQVAWKALDLLKYIVTVVLVPLVSVGALYYSQRADHNAGQAAVTASEARQQGAVNSEQIEGVHSQIQRVTKEARPKGPILQFDD